MLVTMHHAKHVLIYEYLTSARTCIFLKAGVGKCDEVIKYSAPIFSSFCMFFFVNLSIVAIEHDFIIHLHSQGSSVFNTSLGTLRMLMNGMFDPSIILLSLI